MLSENTRPNSVKNKWISLPTPALRIKTPLSSNDFTEEFTVCFEMENATFESMEPSECEQLLSLTRKYVQILKKNMKQYVLEEKEF